MELWFWDWMKVDVHAAGLTGVSDGALTNFGVSCAC